MKTNAPARRAPGTRTGIPQPNPHITATRHSGRAGVQARLLILSHLPNTVKGLVALTGIPLSSVYQYLVGMEIRGSISSRKLAGGGKPVNQYFRKEDPHA